MPRARGRALVALARRASADARLPGIGPWTASYVALRTGDDDAFLPTDLGVRHGLEALGARTAARGERLAEAWRPYGRSAWRTCGRPLRRRGGLRLVPGREDRAGPRP